MSSHTERGHGSYANILARLWRQARGLKGRETKIAPTTKMTPCIQWAGHADTFDGPGMGGCAATSMLTVCIGGGNGHFGGGPMGGCAAAIALSAKTKGISTTCKHLSKIVKLPTTKLTPCISWAGSGGMTIGANHFGDGPMGGCAALSTELRSAHEKMCGGADAQAPSTELHLSAAALARQRKQLERERKEWERGRRVGESAQERRKSGREGRE